MKGTIKGYSRLSGLALKTVQYFESHLTERGSYGSNVQDLSCYYKSPMMFIYARCPDLAVRMLSYLKENYMTREGDFLTNSSLKSAKPEYVEYWSYINGWILRAAQKTQQKDISEPAYQYFLKFNKGIRKGFLTNYFEAKNGVTDVFTTAHHGLIHLEHNNLGLATSAGDYLCDAISKQPHMGEVFYLRFDSIDAPILTYESDQAVFYCVNRKKPDQLYFMLGYPCAYLALLYKETKDEKYLEAAKKYYLFALSCDENIFHSNYSHKLAWAASILYSINNLNDYLTMIEKITNHFIQTQDQQGLWYSDIDINASYDQSAEIACWFMSIADNLLKAENLAQGKNKTVNCK